MKTMNFKMITLLLAVILSSTFSFAAKSKLVTVKGKVVNLRYEPVRGALIKAKNINWFTVTDSLGRFAFKTTMGEKFLVSSVGYDSLEFSIDSLNKVLQLKEYVAHLDNIVCTGYGTVSKKDLVCAVSSVSAISISNKRGRVFRRTAKANVSPSRSVKTTSNNSPQFIKPTQSNSEEYKTYTENKFMYAKADPLSTFSLDVDAASYSNFRRMINSGQMPPKDAVRIEEFINYFSYNYHQPTDEHPVNINTETHMCPWAKKHLLVKIGVKAKDIAVEKLPTTNFVFLIDVSGSMSDENKLPLVKSSLRLLLNNMREQDRVSIVVYAGAAGVVLPSTSGKDKQTIIDALENLQAGGSTAGGQGIELAYQIAQENFIKEGNNRVILCTDGDFNVGVSSEGDLETLIESKRKTGVFLTVLGYGMGNYKDNRMQVLSQKGNGNNAYIDNIQEANKVLVKEFGATMHTVAKDVKLQVEFNPAQVKAYRLVGYESRMLNKEDFNDDAKDAAELGAGHTVTAFYEVVPKGVEFNFSSVDSLKYQKTKESDDVNSKESSELMTIKLRYKPKSSLASVKLEIPVLADDKTSKASDDYTFAASVAMFAQLLRDSEYKGSATYTQVAELAKTGLGEDVQGYRREFVRLVEVVAQMQK